MKKKIILIAGPTASGKTKASVTLAKQINAEIICTDSMQVYKHMNIGTAKVTQDEMEGVAHYMIDELEPSQSNNVAWFKDKVTTYINQIHAKGKIPILVGGTGFYINAILFDTTFEDDDTNEYRSELFNLAKVHGSLALYHRLEELDPDSAKVIHPNNTKRLVRAIEYYYQTGTPISKHNFEQKSKRLQNISPYDYHFFALNMDRATLYNRINQRVDMMLQEGLLEEVKNLYEQGFTEDMVSMKAIGYKEFFPYFNSELSLDETIEKLKQNTRRYAKRQLTWFKNQADPIFIEVDKLEFDADKIANAMLLHTNLTYN
ncbi:MAG: tRNA (adenosine(37)-N6)-dimethylallyltransferase MiaA [Epulopiscium sp. Nuni2H_MBin001]|nr:MAG: tRNA (adenosine(37)-N6)-dimethylallyltransferase MiaA [Epulopiscium sp. Nuni2H_MBin001]